MIFIIIIIIIIITIIIITIIIIISIIISIIITNNNIDCLLLKCSFSLFNLVIYCDVLIKFSLIY